MTKDLKFARERSRKVRNREAAPLTHDQDPWFLGYAAALADVWRLHREGSIVRHILDAGGLTLKHLEEGGVEDFDLAAIRDAVYGTNSERDLERYLKAKP